MGVSRFGAPIALFFRPLVPPYTVAWKKAQDMAAQIIHSLTLKELLTGSSRPVWLDDNKTSVTYNTA
jgi:hypothetical protein